jgi:CRP-like cAMP-binding protein
MIHKKLSVLSFSKPKISLSIHFISRLLKKITESGNLSRIFLFSEGDVFGEMELIDVQPCAASVRAITPTKALTLSNKGFYQIRKYDLKVFSLMIMNLARDISRRLRKADEIIAHCPEFNILYS